MNYCRSTDEVEVPDAAERVERRVCRSFEEGGSDKSSNLVLVLAWWVSCCRRLKEGRMGGWNGRIRIWVEAQKVVRVVAERVKEISQLAAYAYALRVQREVSGLGCTLNLSPPFSGLVR
jgi:hypothetical protein